jgi:NAD(P)H-hydrate epimerase
VVQLAAPDVILETVAGFEPSYMTVPLASTPEGKISGAARDAIHALTQQATCVGCGPGLGRSTALDELVVEMFHSLPCPAVFDADALNALAASVSSLRTPAGPRILTPHPGEMRRLLGQGEIALEQCEARAVEFARRHKVIIALKSHATLVSDGQHEYYNTTGNPGMATGGSGDVLTGVITALVCQGLAPFAATQLGVHIHGRAGDLAANRLGQVSLIARDLIRFLPRAFQGATWKDDIPF